MPTVKDFKKLAKERGLRGYSKLRKAELLSLLEKPIPAPKRDFSERLPALKRDFSKTSSLEKSFNKCSNSSIRNCCCEKR